MIICEKDNSNIHEIRLEELAESSKPLLRKLLELYAYDFSEFDGADISEYGEYGYPRLDCYWHESGRRASLIKVDAKIAGFVMTRDMKIDSMTFHSIAEFFIMRKFRKQGVGKKVARRVLLDRPGDWLVPVLSVNKPAHAFWRKVMQELQVGCEETILEDWEGPVFRLRI